MLSLVLGTYLFHRIDPPNGLIFGLYGLMEVLFVIGYNTLVTSQTFTFEAFLMGMIVLLSLQYLQ
jgi:hypothetical protein